MKEKELVQEIGRVVRFHRKKARMTQQDLAKFAEVGKTVVFDLEKGKETIQLSTLLRILHVLNIKFQLFSPLMHVYEKVKNEES
jgi:y4mF family transcriptional regulator